MGIICGERSLPNMLSANDAWLRLLPSEFPLELVYWNIATIETVRRSVVRALWTQILKARLTKESNLRVSCKEESETFEVAVELIITTSSRTYLVK